MGTSGSHNGSRSGLVPSWGDDPPSAPVDGAPVPGDGSGDASDDANTPINPSIYPPLRPPSPGSKLAAARGNITRGTRTSDDRAVRRGAARYVAASGGGRSAARHMLGSQATASRIAGLAQIFVTQGPAAALRSFDLDGLAGAPVVDVFVALTDALCPPGGTIDEAIARDATLETIAALAAQGVDNFDELTPNDLQEFFIGVVSRSIEGKILNEIGTNSIRLSPDLAAIERAQRMLHDFVDGCVRDRFGKSGSNFADITGEQVDEFVTDLYAATLDLIQILGEAS